MFAVLQREPQAVVDNGPEQQNEGADGESGADGEQGELRQGFGVGELTPEEIQGRRWDAVIPLQD
ncbi:MAG: hypothetical protein QF921_00730 [Pseudomonadales bacterium]|jgi:hypothetical protein|nr:hypothetical protein [Pseudomonadales bacterium]MDP6970040.1 hypothetical protein [Pseudomonadales bacterium]|tara:strand:+ start:4758 stop:4952 length:195 start_codon:yes stop_codon:yes gene_type:complete